MRKASPKQKHVLPLGIKNRMQTELPALVALTAIGEPWFNGEHQSDLLAVALVVAEMATPESIEGQSALALRRLCEQPITAAQKYAIAIHLAECLPWLQVQQNFRVERALEAVANRHLGLAA